MVCDDLEQGVAIGACTAISVAVYLTAMVTVFECRPRYVRRTATTLRRPRSRRTLTRTALAPARGSHIQCAGVEDETLTMAVARRCNKVGAGTNTFGR